MLMAKAEKLDVSLILKGRSRSKLLIYSAFTSTMKGNGRVRRKADDALVDERQGPRARKSKSSQHHRKASRTTFRFSGLCYSCCLARCKKVMSRTLKRS